VTDHLAGAVLFLVDRYDYLLRRRESGFGTGLRK
jgi:hypothetical protein